jgi:hypothetical protein
MSKYLPFGGQTYNLNSSISSTATTITLVSFLEPVSNVPYTMALLNTDIVYATIQPKTTSSEFISFTGITQNADGTATLTGVTRGLAKKYPFTSSATFQLPHSGQSPFIISDAPQVFNKYVTLEDAETITGLKTFPAGGNASAPVSGSSYSAPTNDLEYASKKYVDTVAIAGAPDSSTTVKGIGKVSVAPISSINPIFVGDNDPRVPTQGENDALVGDNTDIAVGSGNKFVTQTGLQHNAEKYAADTSGSSTAYVVTLSPVPTSYTAGMVVYAKIVNANTTTTPTINVNGLGAKTIVKITNTALAVGDIAANMFCTFIYDGTNMVLQNPVANFSQSFLSALTTSSVSTTQNIDTVFTCGFAPKVIQLFYYLNGVTNGVGVFSQGVALFNGSGTIISNNYTSQNVNTNVYSPEVSTANPFSGSAVGNNTIVTLSVLSVSSSGCTIRMANVEGGSGGFSGSAKYTVVITA